MFRAHHAFTLLEMLVVLTVIGVLLTITAVNLLPLHRQTLVRQGATDVMVALQKARSESQRFNTPVTVTVPNSPLATTLSVTRGDMTRTITLPAGVTLRSVGSTNTVTYLPPHGTVEMTGAAFRLQHEQAARPTVVGATGIAGKVVTYDLH